MFGYEKSLKKNRAMITCMLAGFVLGLIIMNLGKGFLLQNTSLLSEYTLYEVKYAQIDKTAFFWYLLPKRIGLVFFITLLATTWLGVILTWTITLWLGASVGMLLMASIIRYGIKGILLIFAGLFPQAIFYIPAIIMLLKICGELSQFFYTHKGISPGETYEAKNKIKSRILPFLVLIGVVIIGCLFESYVNPIIITKLLLIF